MMSLRFTGRCLSRSLNLRWSYCAHNSSRYKFKLNAPLSNNYAALKPSSEPKTAEASTPAAKNQGDERVQVINELLSALNSREKKLTQLVNKMREANENELRYLNQTEQEKQALQMRAGGGSASSAAAVVEAHEAVEGELAGAEFVDAAAAAAHGELDAIGRLGEHLIDNVHLVEDDDATAVKISKSLDAQMNLLKAELEKKRLASDMARQAPHGLSVHSPVEAMLFEKQLRQFNQSMLAYVDVCAHSPGMLQEAYLLLKKLTKMENEASQKAEAAAEGVKFDEALSLTVSPGAESNRSEKAKKRAASARYIDDVEVYNRLMFAFARRGKLSSINYLFQQMCQEKHLKLKPNLNSYAAALQCIGHMINNGVKSTSSKTANLRLNVERILWDIKKFNFSLDDLATNTTFSSEQQHDIRTAIRAVMPDFEFRNELDHSLENPLVKSLKSNARAHRAQEAVYPAQLLDKEAIMANFREQLANEKSVLIEVPSIEHQGPFAKKESERKQQAKAKIFKDFKDNLHKSFSKQLLALKKSNSFKESFMYPFLTAMDKSVYVELLLQEAQEICQKSQYFSESLSTLSYALGSKLEKKYQKQLMERNGDIAKIEKAYESFADFFIRKLKSPFESESEANYREAWQRIVNEQNLKINSESHAWPSSVRYQLGKYLLQEVLMKSCKIDTNLINNASQPGEKYEHAFHTVYRIVGYYKYPQVKAHPALSRLYESSLIFDANLMPMVTMPLPWLSPQQGGYFINHSALLRSSSDEQYAMIGQRHVSHINPVLDSLNLLSTCPWRINTRILDLLIDVFNRDGNRELEVPLPVSRGPPVPRPPRAKLGKDEYKAYLREKDAATKVRSEMYSLWCTELYRLSIANMYRDKVIYFPHNLDFRGRSYPMPPHFNHLGSDISRSIISLAVGKKLGPKGLDTLKLHLINLTGTMKKATLAERLAHANSIMDEIVDSAERPFTGRLWWQRSEEKWQTLACCMEIAEAVKSGDPAEFVSHFPIHQDGSCNGLQHYAALGRDQEGAVSVNLSPSERPQDVYSTVLDLVEAHRLKDEPNSEIARLLTGHIKRKVIKQTVMTTVYNVTMYGAKLQILRQLEDLKGFPQARAGEASAYLAKKTFSSIRELFTSAKEIQDWFGKCAYLIAKIRDSTVKWHTPLMLPISQPYYKKVSTKKGGAQALVTDKPNSLKQRSAFPPNYVHSLDSCHMMLTSLFCEKAGITFISVHDCFWTHACDVDLMNKICREQFIALHSLPLLETLSKSFLEAHKFTQEEIDSHENEDAKSAMIQFNNILANVPKKGNFDLNKVKQSTYFFS